MTGAMSAVLLAAAPASAQGLAFPSSFEHYGGFQPTAYFDHGGWDWHCGRLTYAGHLGTDFGVGGFPGMDQEPVVAAAAGGTVVAAHDGELDRCTTGDCPGAGGLGNFVVVEHAGGLRTVYAHLAQWSVSVAVGDRVACGQTLGKVGSSGASTGPHLHFEVRSGPGLDVAEDPFAGPCGGTGGWANQGPYGQLPALACGAPPTCAPATDLACGRPVYAANDDPGATVSTWRYACSDWTYSGPELAWIFTPPVSDTVRLELAELTADLDLYVLDETACDGTGCVAAGTRPQTADESVTFEAEAGRTYVVVVDGWEGAASDFVLTAHCDGFSEEPAPPDTTDTGEPFAPESPGDPPPAPGAAGAGCGCGTGAGLHGAAWLALAASVAARRRSVAASARSERR